MRLSRFLLAIFLLTFSTVLYSQSDFRPGYFISQEHDTIYGLIDYRGDIRNSKTCVFKKDKNSDIIQYSPSDIKAYRFIESKYYISKHIMSNNEVKLIFAEYLVNGISNLYYYIDQKGNSHYLIETNEGRIAELTNNKKTVYIKGKGEFKTKTNKHIGLLKSTFNDCQEIQSEINNTELNHKSLINITKKYHTYVCDDEECIVYEKKLPFIKISIAPTLGFGYSKLSLTKNIFYSGINFKNNFYPSIGVTLKSTLPKFNDKLSLQIDILLSKNSYYGFSHIPTLLTNYNDLYVYINTTTLNTSAALKYSYPKGDIRPTIAFGGIIKYFINNNTKLIKEEVLGSTVTTTEYIDIPITKILLGGFFQLGFDFLINKKLKLFSNFKYSFCVGNTNYQDINDKFSNLYSFKKLKILDFNINIGIYL